MFPQTRDSSHTHNFKYLSQWMSMSMSTSIEDTNTCMPDDLCLSTNHHQRMMSLTSVVSAWRLISPRMSWPSEDTFVHSNWILINSRIKVEWEEASLIWLNHSNLKRPDQWNVAVVPYFTTLTALFQYPTLYRVLWPLIFHLSHIFCGFQISGIHQIYSRLPEYNTTN